jgi:hypothetical protein
MLPQVSDAGTVATFEMLAIPNPAKSKKAQRPIYDEFEVCRIRFAANKHTVGVFPAHEVFKQAPDEMGFTSDWTYAMEYADAYKKFKDGEAQTVAGTPLSELTFLTQGKRLELKALNIHTAEALASLDGHPLKQLGMGGRDLKNQAIAYLENATKTMTAAEFAAVKAAQDQEIADLKALVDKLSKGEAPEPGQPSTPFDDFGDEDLVNWIKDAEPTMAMDGRWGRKKLLEIAEGIRAKVGRKAAA